MQSRKSKYRRKNIFALFIRNALIYACLGIAVTLIFIFMDKQNVFAPHPAPETVRDGGAGSDADNSVEKTDDPEKKKGETDDGQSEDSKSASNPPEMSEEERRKREAKEKEAAYFGNEDKASLAMRSGWTLMPDTASQGDVILVRSDQPGQVEWQGKAYALTAFGTGYYTYLPIAIDLKPGRYPIGDQVLTVNDKAFEVSRIQVSEEQNSIRRDTERIMADQRKIDRARSRSAPEFLFPPASAFMKPVEGEMTTPFGYTRYVNGEYAGSHRAIDWAAETGTPVRATNDGVVALSEYLHLTGNSVYIDHGMDLFSQYIHLSELKVKAGDRVKKGDVIGLVGSTGFSTGPHLHFTFWAHNVPVNPNLFLGTTPFHWYEGFFQED